MRPDRRSPRLSQVDAFFVAYQERSGILMSHGCELTIRAPLSEELVRASLEHLVSLWPRLGQRLHKRRFGLEWSGEPDVAAMLRTRVDVEELGRWRNRTIDPFTEPPFQLLWLSNGERQTLSCRVHHAAADGGSLLLLASEMARFIASPSPERGAAPLEQSTPAGFRSLYRPRRLGGIGRLATYQRWIGSEARNPTTARLPLDSTAPGDVTVVAATIRGGERDSLLRAASAQRVTPSALVAACWMRTLHGWMSRREEDSNPSIALEVPVSLRRRRGSERWLGNFVAPLVVVGDARTEPGELALAIHRQLARGYRQGLHLATPLLTSLARYLPWEVFRRVSVGTSATGFATGHFTWLRASSDLESEIKRLSRGVMDIEDVALWTPVCREMGAALAVLELSGSLEIFVTHRLNALSPRDARDLVDRLSRDLRSVAEGVEHRRLA